ncbi:sigma-70 family RNA polymerase sigma factor [Sphingobacterium sp. SGG-5]|uniref:RNA polymerase sigma factor n=1 Tax=Sphingobacterium sp. SGG-5 TaxID=2710881 RepID=UPI0013EBA7BC|nr:sigma-70 family RNA polymerase sigma factor [Sphingobacterium sp. SGG-5]NGM60605.1 sigma-70 family RNA polymerase sigma factor [Sphingobacterium sp. SGG-5]
MKDPHLIYELQQGNEIALRTVFKLYGNSLLYLAHQLTKNKQTAEEIVNDIFLKVWDLRANFETQSKLQAFLYIATKNACYNFLKKPIQQLRMENIEDQFDLIYQDQDIFKTIIKAELFEKILQEVSKLPARQREIFYMTYVEDYTVEEICQKLALHPNAVYANKSRALTALKNALRVYDPDLSISTIILLLLLK